MPQANVYIGVVGPSAASAREAANAQDVGRRLAELGWFVVCGGMGGVMEAACRGARSVGGTTIGLLPGFSRGEGNDYLTVSIPTGLGELRNGLLVRSSDALVAIGGSWGTFSEISFALRAQKIVIGLDTWALRADPEPVPDLVHVQAAEQVIPELRSRLRAPRPDLL